MARSVLAYGVGNLGGKIEARDFELTFDHPEEEDGKNLGMMPGEIFLASLASCSVHFVQRYAEKFNIKLNSIKVSVEADNQPIPDDEVDINSDLSYTNIHYTYEIDADNSEEEISNYIKFVDETCAIKKTVTNPSTPFSYTIV